MKGVTHIRRPPKRLRSVVLGGIATAALVMQGVTAQDEIAIPARDIIDLTEGTIELCVKFDFDPHTR